METGLRGGFSDQARDGARLFRAALDAMARPGRIHEVAEIHPPTGISAAAAGLLLTLADPGTPLWLAPRLAEGEIARWLRFHTNAPLTGPEDAAFGLGGWDEVQPLSAWSVGTPDYPDRSATLIVEVPALCGGPRLTLTGPGIEGREVLAPILPRGAAAEIAATRHAFPLGIDLFLTASSSFAALPRTTQIGELNDVCRG